LQLTSRSAAHQFWSVNKIMMNGLVIRPAIFALGLVGLFLVTTGCTQSGTGQTPLNTENTVTGRVTLGAEQVLQERLPDLRGKRVGIVAHAASIVYDSIHTVDALRRAGVEMVLIFAPEHGFRGNTEAGAPIANSRDTRTGIEVVSLYGQGKHPKPADLQRIDILLFDLQDVGARFYTYLSTLHYVMESCAKQGKPLWVLDRPNPNGWYTAGPLLEQAHTSFIGLQPGLPIVHGLTVGEYARMANRESWLRETQGRTCPLEVVAMRGYTHSMRWPQTGVKWVPPSPNLRTTLAAELYPALCWFEGTTASVGRGTELPFQQVGMPEHGAFRESYGPVAAPDSIRPRYLIQGADAQVVAFVPLIQEGRAEKPPHRDKTCYGVRFFTAPDSGQQIMALGLELLQNFYNEHAATAGSTAFLTPYFEHLVGTTQVRDALQKQENLLTLLPTWERALQPYRTLRKQYLLYPE
jgi:uncharacterized protein YbbC (DUF1343 family)